jgi:hypothetical protein
MGADRSEEFDTPFLGHLYNCVLVAMLEDNKFRSGIGLLADYVARDLFLSQGEIDISHRDILAVVRQHHSPILAPLLISYGSLLQILAARD